MQVRTSWRTPLDLAGVELSDAWYTFPQEHIRMVERVPRLGFWLMEVKRPRPAQDAKADMIA